MVSFLHAADLHLGLRITRFAAEVAKKIREARFQALERVREVAKERAVGFVIVAGDLFDDQAVDTDLARRAFDLLESFPSPVFIISGNHDPLLPGSVWDRPPWNQAYPRKIRVLREPKPEPFGAEVTLLPCPVFRKTSLNDPTSWIRESVTQESTIRIGIAHGSLKVRPELPADDHLISAQAAQDLKLDYLALGHWHGRQLFRSADGVERTAYSGVHEPMRYPGTTDHRTGWVPYSTSLIQEFLDSGRGEVLHVQIDQPGSAPQIEPIDVGHLLWEDLTYSLGSKEELGAVINEVATRPTTERRLLRLKLKGILDAEAMLRMSHLREVLDRYLWGELDDTELHVRPTAEEIQDVAGQGVLRRVLETLQQEAASAEPDTSRLAERAMLLLYQIAREASA